LSTICEAVVGTVVPSGETPLDEDAAATFTVICAEPNSPPESRTDAVIVCVPAESTRFRLDPYPSNPSILDDHPSDADKLPSSLSVDDPLNVTDAPLPNEAPFPGDEIFTVGVVFLLVDVGG